MRAKLIADGTIKEGDDDDVVDNKKGNMIRTKKPRKEKKEKVEEKMEEVEEEAVEEQTNEQAAADVVEEKKP